MKYIIKSAFIILDDNGDVIDYRDTLEAATELVADIEQDNEDRQAIEDAFEAADN